MGNKKENKEDSSRRSFLKIGLASGAVAALGKLGFAGSNQSPEVRSGEKVKMLTPDGKLVEIDKEVLEAAAKKKASVNEIHNFVSYKKQKP